MAEPVRERQKEFRREITVLTERPDGLGYESCTLVGVNIESRPPELTTEIVNGSGEHLYILDEQNDALAASCT